MNSSNIHNTFNVGGKTQIKFGGDNKKTCTHDSLLKTFAKAKYLSEKYTNNKEYPDEIFGTSNIIRKAKIAHIHNAINENKAKLGKHISNICLADLGSGVGNIIIPLLRLGYTIDAYEINKESIKTIQQRVNRNNLRANLTIKCAPIESIVGRGNYDVVTLIEVLEHTYNPDNVLNILAQMLKKGGLLIVHVPNGYSIHELFITRPVIWLRKLIGIKKPKGYHHVQFFTMRKLEELFKENGFMIMSINKAYFFPYMPMLYKLKFVQKIDIFLSYCSPLTWVTDWQFVLRKSDR